MTTDQIAGAVALERISRGQLIRRRFFRNKTAVFGLGVIAFMFLFAFGGPFIGQWSYTENDFSSLLQGPSASHWFGTTQIGVDVFAQTTRGLQKSLIIGLLVAVFSTGLSAIVGAFAGYLGGRTDKVTMWFVDLLLVLPSFQENAPMVIAEAMAAAASPGRSGDQVAPYLLLQPGWQSAEGQQLAVDYVRSHPHWRLSLQSHKWLGVR